MRVRLGTVVVDNEARKALNRHHGRKGLATRKDVRAFYIGHAAADLAVVVDENHGRLFEEHEVELPLEFEP